MIGKRSSSCFGRPIDIIAVGRYGGVHIIKLAPWAAGQLDDETLFGKTALQRSSASVPQATSGAAAAHSHLCP